MDENIYAYWLSNIPDLGSVTYTKLMEYAGSMEGVWELSEKELASPVLGLPVNLRKSILSSRNEEKIVSSYESLKKDGIAFYGVKHPAYPSGLGCIPDPPLGIYVRGSLPPRGIPCIAIVGARNCSEYGALCARRISERLASSGFPIISGMARGIDGIAQKAALETGGYSCAVMGCGVDICYPRENRALYDKLKESGGIISEYPPGTAPRPHLFPARNRIISGLSDVCIVLEARERSGSLITADMALDQGRDVYALPGRITDSLSGGTNRLIRQGAGIILSPEDLVEELLTDRSVLSKAEEPEDFCQMCLTDTPDLSPAERQVLMSTGLDPKTVNAIQGETRLDTGTLMKCLMKLSVRGLILQDQGLFIRRFD